MSADQSPSLGSQPNDAPQLTGEALLLHLLEVHEQAVEPTLRLAAARMLCRFDDERVIGPLAELVAVEWAHPEDRMMMLDKLAQYLDDPTARAAVERVAGQYLPQIHNPITAENVDFFKGTQKVWDYAQQILDQHP